MESSSPGAHGVVAHTNHVVDYHYDETRPGKPLYLLIPGGLIAFASLLVIAFVAYFTWFGGSIDPGTGNTLILLLAPFYIGGVFVFCYGYELYDLHKALRDTAIIVFTTFAAVFIVAILAVAVGAMGKSKSSWKSSGSSSSLGSSPRVNTWGGGFSFNPIFLGGGLGTHTETREVIREVPVAPPAPQPITCPSCGRPYIPAENHFACPNCGTPTPPEFIHSSDGVTAGG